MAALPPPIRAPLALCALLVACAQHRPATDAVPRPHAAPQSLATTVVAALDSEALFTVAGGLKPLSSGFWASSVPTESGELDEIDAMRRALQSLDDEQLSWGVMAFAKPHGGKRSYHAWVAHRGALAALVARRADVFAAHGISPATRPAELLAIVERMPRTDRFTSYGLLFGYPEHAVEFYVAADRERDRHPRGIAPRRFLSIPTFGAKTGRFVYAVPPDHEPAAADLALRAAAGRILESYRPLRERHLGAGPREALRLLAATKALTPQLEGAGRDHLPGAVAHPSFH